MDPGGAEKKVVRVTIFNQSYTLRAPGDPREIEELAKQIDGLMESIASRSGDSEASRIAVLACLHLADRLRTLERQLANLTERVERKSEQLSLLLDQAIEGERTQNSEHRTQNSRSCFFSVPNEPMLATEKAMRNWFSFRVPKLKRRY